MKDQITIDQFWKDRKRDPCGTVHNLESDQMPYLIDQYKICVDLVEKQSERRDVLFKFFFSINAVMFGGLWTMRINIEKITMAGNFELILCLVGLGVSLIWLSTGWSLRHIARAKWRIINDIEHFLPARPFFSEYFELEANRVRIGGHSILWFLPTIFCFVWGWMAYLQINTLFQS